jgi:hypothetical protein
MKPKDQLLLEQIYLNILEEAKKKKSKERVNPWAIAKSMAKEKGFGAKKEEEVVKGIKRGAKKSGKKIVTEANIENMTDEELADYLDVPLANRANYNRDELVELAHELSKEKE